MNDLSKFSYQEILKELNKRGYHTDFIVGIEDVEKNIEDINEEQGTNISMTEKQKAQVLRECFNTDGFLQLIAECIQENITHRHLY